MHNTVWKVPKNSDSQLWVLSRIIWEAFKIYPCQTISEHKVSVPSMEWSLLGVRKKNIVTKSIDIKVHKNYLDVCIFKRCRLTSELL